MPAIRTDCRSAAPVQDVPSPGLETENWRSSPARCGAALRVDADDAIVVFLINFSCEAVNSRFCTRYSPSDSGPPRPDHVCQGPFALRRQRNGWTISNSLGSEHTPSSITGADRLPRSRPRAWQGGWHGHPRARSSDPHSENAPADPGQVPGFDRFQAGDRSG